jgi:hypothetical protein
MLNAFATDACDTSGRLREKTDPMKRILTWGRIAVLLPVIAAGVWLLSSTGFATDFLGREYPPLRSESFGSDGDGNMVLWRIHSSVQLIPEEKGDRQALWLFMSQSGARAGSVGDFYRYRYLFENDGSSAIRINLSEWDIVQSPLTEVLQDFALELDPQESATIEFLTDQTIPPHDVLSPVNIAVWNDAKDRWAVMGAGQASIYTPSAPGLLKAAFKH